MEAVEHMFKLQWMERLVRRLTFKSVVPVGDHLQVPLRVDQAVHMEVVQVPRHRVQPVMEEEEVQDTVRSYGMVLSLWLPQEAVVVDFQHFPLPGQVGTLDVPPVVTEGVERYVVESHQVELNLLVERPHLAHAILLVRVVHPYKEVVVQVVRSTVPAVAVVGCLEEPVVIRAHWRVMVEEEGLRLAYPIAHQEDIHAPLQHLLELQPVPRINIIQQESEMAPSRLIPQDIKDM
jgi:hypothetical protein